MTPHIWTGNQTGFTQMFSQNKLGKMIQIQPTKMLHIQLCWADTAYYSLPRWYRYSSTWVDTAYQDTDTALYSLPRWYKYSSTWVDTAYQDTDTALYSLPRWYRYSSTELIHSWLTLRNTCSQFENQISSTDQVSIMSEFMATLGPNKKHRD